MDISYDGAILHVAQETDKREKETLVWTGGSDKNMLVVLSWECEKLALVTSVNSNVFPVFSGKKSKPMNT